MLGKVFIFLLCWINFILCTYEGNRALYFDGTKSFVKVGNVATDYDLLEYWTLEAWIKPDGILTQFQPNIIGFPGRHPNLEICGNTSNPDCHSYLQPLTQLRDATGNYYTITSPNQLDPKDEDGWYHLAGSWDNSTLSLYVNGLLETKINPYTKGFIDNFKCQFPHCEEGLQIGGYHMKQDQGFFDGQHFKGAMDEIRVWKIGRTQKQIQSSMSKTLKGTEPGLMYYWRMDEGQGTLIKSLAFDAYGTLGGGVPDAEPKWIVSNSPVTLMDKKEDNFNPNISSKPTWPNILIGALISLVSFVIGLIVGTILISKNHSGFNGNDKGLIKDDGL
jgi:hypothetical protein